MSKDKQSKAAYAGQQNKPPYSGHDYIQDSTVLLHSIEQEHNEECLRRFGIYYLALCIYERMWPKYCKACQGLGGKYSSYDPSGGISCSLSQGSMTDFDICPHCVEHDVCPRCGAVGCINEDVTLCNACHFDFSYKMAAPQEPECFCYEEKHYQESKAYHRAIYRELGVLEE